MNCARLRLRGKKKNKQTEGKPWTAPAYGCAVNNPMLALITKNTGLTQVHLYPVLKAIARK